jgi:hypothetical protein
MALRKVYRLSCDRCGATTPAAFTGYDASQKLREWARRHKWARVPKSRTHDGTDICPDCTRSARKLDTGVQ